MPKVRELKAHIFKKQKENWYVEEPWCAMRLFEEIKFKGAIHDPCCGGGNIPFWAQNAEYRVTCGDIVDRDKLDSGIPFRLGTYADDKKVYDNIVTNPPFDDINKTPWPFVTWALAHAKYKVALLVPFKWLAGDKRTRFLETTPLAEVWLMTPRPSMPTGEYLLAGNKAEGGKQDFAWAIFNAGFKSGGPVPALKWLRRDPTL